MTATGPHLKTVFGQALEIDSPADRAAYLDRACGDDTDLRAGVERLLQAHENAGRFLDPTGELPLAESSLLSPLEGPGTVIGPYRLVEQIGEGGMGLVFLAEQSQPVRRLVALKVLKPGLDTRHVLARFEAERQALALMDHPNIAKVLDGGATTAGRPYFVMDLVRGAPITRYCDEHRLSPRQRLELFVPVCEAIQHAHQKGVIHRDLKPSNVLVALYDGKPVPKVIDFGVAKAAGQPLTEQTLVTGFGTIVGTLEYMSPEQAEINQLDIDTRSDIYSLGVLLYELLTGSPPFTRKELEKASVLEILRVIREQEPSTPSTKLSTADGLPALAANRGTEPARLTRLVRGELDWIVMKALEKDRSRRYETANGLAADVRRYLADEPVLACPPSAGYRLRKYSRRHWKAMATVTAFALLLVAATGTSIGLASWALRERNQTQTQKELAEANEKAANARAEEIRAVLDFVENRVFAAARPLGQENGLGRDVTLRQAIESALAYVEESFRDQPLIEARLRATIGVSFLYLGDGKTAEAQFEHVRAVREANLGPDHPDTLATMTGLGSAYHAQGRHRESLALNRKTFELSKARLGRDHPTTIRIANNLALSLGRLAQPYQALELLEENFGLQKAKLGIDHANTLETMTNLGLLYRAAGRSEDALKFGEEAYRRQKAKSGPDHPLTLSSGGILAAIYGALGRHEDAFTLRNETLRLRKEKLGPDHPHTVISVAELATSYHYLGRYEDSVKLREETLPLMKAKFGAGAYETLFVMDQLANSYDALGRHEQAAKMREEIRQRMKATHGPGRPEAQSPTNGQK